MYLQITVTETCIPESVRQCNIRRHEGSKSTEDMEVWGQTGSALGRDGVDLSGSLVKLHLSVNETAAAGNSST